MAGKSVSKAVKQHPDINKPITAEERALLCNYRELVRWDRTFIFMILQIMACGRHSEKTDGYSWAKMRAISDLPRTKKAAA